MILIKIIKMYQVDIMFLSLISLSSKVYNDNQKFMKVIEI